MTSPSPTASAPATALPASAPPPVAPSAAAAAAPVAPSAAAPPAAAPPATATLTPAPPAPAFSVPIPSATSPPQAAPHAAAAPPSAASAPPVKPATVAAPPAPTPVTAPITATASAPAPIIAPKPLASAPPPRIVKTYTVGHLSPGHHTILNNNQPFLWSHTKEATLKSEQTRLAKDAANNHKVIILMMDSVLAGNRVLSVANPDRTPPEQWAQWPDQQSHQGEYTLYHQGRKHMWRPSGETLEHDYFTLSDDSGKSVATATGAFDRIDFTEELGEEVELLSLLGLLAARTDE